MNYDFRVKHHGRMGSWTPTRKTDFLFGNNTSECLHNARNEQNLYDFKSFWASEIMDVIY